MQHMIKCIRNSAMALLVLLVGTACAKAESASSVIVPTADADVSNSLDAAAEAELHLTSAAALVCFLDNGRSFEPCTATTLRDIEPTLGFSDAPDPSMGPTTISVLATSSHSFAAAVLSASGTCYVATVAKDSTDIAPDASLSAPGSCKPA